MGYEVKHENPSIELSNLKPDGKRLRRNNARSTRFVRAFTHLFPHPDQKFLPLFRSHIV